MSIPYCCLDVKEEFDICLKYKKKFVVFGKARIILSAPAPRSFEFTWLVFCFAFLAMRHYTPT